MVSNHSNIASELRIIVSFLFNIFCSCDLMQVLELSILFGRFYMSFDLFDS